MVTKKRVYPIKKNLKLFESILASIAIVTILIAITTFVLYGRARMKEQEHNEQLFLRIHYASLFLLLLLGILYMFFMVETQS